MVSYRPPPVRICIADSLLGAASLSWSLGWSLDDWKEHLDSYFFEFEDHAYSVSNPTLFKSTIIPPSTKFHTHVHIGPGGYVSISILDIAWEDCKFLPPNPHDQDPIPLGDKDIFTHEQAHMDSWELLKYPCPLTMSNARPIRADYPGVRAPCTKPKI